MGCGDFDKAEFLDRIDSIRQQTFKISTVQSGFKATGPIPYNPDRVISKLREAAPRPTSQDEPHSGLDPSMPTTIPSLKSQGKELLRDARHM